MDISKTVAIITGGASGLGEATARRLVSIGAKGVVLLDVNKSRGDSVAAELGSNALFIQTDITDAGAVDAAVEVAVRKFGAINVVLCAAAIPGPARLVGRRGPIDLAIFDKVMRVNVYGTLHVYRAAAAAMIKNEPNEEGERGLMIGVSSGAAYEGQIGQVAYSASKAAIVGMTMPLARELAEHGVRVVSIAPGAFETPIYDSIPEAVRQRMIDVLQFPKRFGKPAEFALFIEELVRNPMHNARTYRLDAGCILPATF